jgi:ppGpp synthetase/RelA/SpoT-type nucleotidyltranferase
MNENEFLSKWNLEKPTYQAWGAFVSQKITECLKERGKDPNCFLKMPPSVRAKDNRSLIDKAFYRKKDYQDPYKQIEDKVGVRFVALLQSDVELLSEIIRSVDLWTCDFCKNYLDEREEQPLLFTYQSMHFVVRPKESIEYEGLSIPGSVACEIQVRTLLQHAHSELTHDALYKTNKTIQPKIQRTVAKSMALIETTDEFFTRVTDSLNYGPMEEFDILVKFNALYESLIAKSPFIDKSSLVIWDNFEDQVSENFCEQVEKFYSSNPSLVDLIKSRYETNPLYQQSIVLLLIWMLKNKPTRLQESWPISNNILNLLAADVGVSLNT